MFILSHEERENFLCRTLFTVRRNLWSKKKSANYTIWWCCPLRQMCLYAGPLCENSVIWWRALCSSVSHVIQLPFLLFVDVQHIANSCRSHQLINLGVVSWSTNLFFRFFLWKIWQNIWPTIGWHPVRRRILDPSLLYLKWNPKRKEFRMHQLLTETTIKKCDKNYHDKASLQNVSTNCHNKLEQNKLHFMCFYLFPLSELTHPS